jgi:multidrug efflux system membrane fusion protein
MRSRKRNAMIGGVAVLAAGGVTAAALTIGLPRADGNGSRSALPTATAQVERQTLVDTESHDGTLGYGDSWSINSRLSGTVTDLAAKRSVVRRGGVLYTVDQDPVVLLYGRMPAYRELSAGSTGTDVKQFEKNLWALGYRGFTVDKTYSSATATAVRKWQKKLGLTRTGSVDPARIVYAAGPVRVDSRTAAIGDQARPGAGMLSVTGTSRVATVELDISDERLAKVGAAVEVTLPDGGTAKGRITDAETVIEKGEGQEADTTVIDVTVGFAKAPKGLDQATVAVEFTASRHRNVLTIPVEALLALSEGGYGVQVVTGATTSIVPVDTGLFADGRVEVTGAGVNDGTVIGTAK